MFAALTIHTLFIMKKRSALTLLLLPVAASALLAGCSPTVKIEASDKPITINMNIKIDHEIRVKVDKELDSLLNQKSALF